MRGWTPHGLVDGRLLAALPVPAGAQLGEAAEHTAAAADPLAAAARTARDATSSRGLRRLDRAPLSAPRQTHAVGPAHHQLTGVQGERGTGWDLHEWRHSGLTHLGKGGASLLMLMAKSRHKKAENVRKYFHPSPEGIAEVTSLLAPGDRRR